MTIGKQAMRGVIRRLRPDRNPLRRTADRVEAAVLAGLFLVSLAAIPLAGRAAAGWAAAAGARTEHAQADWRQTGAVLLRDAPVEAHALSQASTEPLVPARWTAPDGTRHAGDVPAPGGTRVGTAVVVWTDRTGTLETIPERRSDVIFWEVLDALAAAAGVVTAVLIVGLLARRALDKRRLAAWDFEWSLANWRGTGRL